MTATLPSVKSLKPAVRAFPIGAATPDDVIGQERKVGQDLQDWTERDCSNSMPRSVSLWSHLPSQRPIKTRELTVSLTENNPELAVRNWPNG